MSTTENYNFQIQEHGSLLWDTPLNENFLNIDSQIKARQNELNTHLADYVRQPGYAITTGSQANAYVITLNPAPTSYIEGMGFDIKINIANTGTSTLNVNGLGAKTIKDSLGNDLTSDALKQNQTYRVRYDSISGNFILASSSSSNIVGDATENDLLAGKKATTPSGVITGTIPTKSGIIYTPTTVDQVITTGYEDGTCKVKGDSNHVPPNIRAGVTDFGVIGTFTADATATAPYILNGYKAYGNGNEINGNMVNNGAVVITPSTSNIPIPQGYHTGTGYVKGDPNKIPSNIVSGVTIDGVAGIAVKDVFILGENMLYSNDERAGTMNTSATKVKEIKVNRSGNIRVRFDIAPQYVQYQIPFRCYGQIYVNGLPRGILRTTILDNETYTTFTEDISVNNGDFMQIYTYGVTGYTYSYIRNFRIYVGNLPLFG